MEEEVGKSGVINKCKQGSKDAKLHDVHEVLKELSPSKVEARCKQDHRKKEVKEKVWVEFKYSLVNSVGDY